MTTFYYTHADFESTLDTVISYITSQDICTGVGTIEITLAPVVPAIDPWDEIRTEDAIYGEMETVKSYYYVNSVSRSEKDGSTIIYAQDATKKLTDYFIDDSYTVEAPSNTYYWIDKFLDEVGIAHNNPGAGQPMMDGTQLGLSSAYDTLITLLQQSGWYMYANGKDSVRIGKLGAGGRTSRKLDDTVILNIYTNKSDKMLRNRAVVMGNYDTVEEEQVLADLSVITPWNYDASDKRAVVLVNSNIYSNDNAENLARGLLTEFARINFEITLELAAPKYFLDSEGLPKFKTGLYHFSLGERVLVRSKYYKGSGVITTIEVSYGKDGVIHTIILDQRCPRLFGFLGEIDDYVYVGTTESGVWRKPLDSGDWEDFSNGLPSGTGITDLYINNSILAATTVSGELYYRETDTSWIPFIPSGIFDEADTEYPPSGLFAKCVTMDHYEDTIIAGYNTLVSGMDDKRCWVVELDSWSGQLRADQVYVGSGIDIAYNVHIADLDTNDVENILCVESEELDITPLIDLGIRTNTKSYGQDSSVIILPESDNLHVERIVDYVDYYDSINGGYSWATPILQCNNPDRIFAYFMASTDTTHHIATRIKYDLTWDTDHWDISTTIAEVNCTGSVPVTSDYGNFLYKDPNIDNIMYATRVYLSVDGNTLTFYHYKIDFDAETFDRTYTTTYDLTDLYFVGGDESKNPSTLVQRDEFIWGACYKIVGNTISFYQLKYDQINDISYPNLVGTRTITGIEKAGILTSGGSSSAFAPTMQSSTGFIFSFLYAQRISGKVTELGIIYGSKDYIADEVIWTRPPFNTNTLYGHIQTSGFVGDTKLVTNLMCAYAFTLQDVLTNYTYAAFIVTHQDNYMVVTTHLYELLNPVDEDDVNEFFANNEYPRDWASQISFNPLSSKYLNTCYYIRPYNTGGANGILIMELPSNTIKLLLNAADLGVDDLEPLYYQNADDFSDTIYISIDDGVSLKLATINLNGELLHIYDDIGTANPINVYIANGFYLTGIDGATFLWPNDGYYYFAYVPSYEILKQNLDIFENILTPSGLYQVEISKNSPTELYHITVSGESIYLPIYQSFSNEVDDFDNIETTFPIYDGRIFDIITPSGFVLASGIMEDTNWRYLGVAMDEGLKAFPVTLSGSSIIIATFSGGITHLETSNYGDNPYIFVSNSGFYQRDPNAATFIDYSAELPNSEITIIRLDDTF